MVSWDMHVSSCLFSELSIFSGPVHTMLEESERRLNAKTHQTFWAPDEVKNRTNYWPFWISVLKNTLAAKLLDYSEVIAF